MNLVDKESKNLVCESMTKNYNNTNLMPLK